MIAGKITILILFVQSLFVGILRISWQFFCNSAGEYVFMDV